MIWRLCAFFLLAGCGSPFFSGDDDPPDASPDADTDTDTDVDSDADTDTGDPPCQDDRLEDNDHDAEAVAVEDDDSIENLIVCDDDDDWFAIDLELGQFLEATVVYTHQEKGDLAVQLVSTDGERVVYYENTADDDEVLRWWPWGELGSGTYYVRVYGRPVAAGAELARTPYDIAFDVQDEVPCFPDEREEDDSPDEALELIGLDLADDLTVCPGDADYASVDAEEGKEIVALATYYSLHGHLDVEILDATGVETLATAFDYDPMEPTSLFGRERAVYVAPATGTYIIRVQGTEGVTNEYGLRTDLREPCADDPFEENDFPPWATEITAGIHDGVTCYYDNDWYSFDVAEGQNIAVDLQFEQLVPDDDIDLYLFAPDTLTQLDGSASGDSDELVDAEGVDAGRYYVVVTGFEDGENTYTLELLLD